MQVIGLTGKACAGKNLYAKQFELQGCVVVDVDTLGHHALSQRIPQLVASFGDSILVGNEIDRKVLGSLVFSDPVQLRKLEAITHPVMVERCRELIEAAKREQKPALVLNAALLYRMKLHVLCDRVVFIQAPFLVRFMRAKKREHSTFKRFVAREKAQKDISKKIFPSSLEVSVMHNGTAQVRIHRQVTTYCATIGIGVSSV
ncbi:MAG: dephospho-CoA kinase [Sphaerochaeta sp.]|nr:dephospho-CoA kinase [Sphaerochaeta sp.]